MFPREYRLSRQRDIQRVLKSGRRFPSPALMLRCAPNRLEHPRVAVVVGTVVSKRATVRNRIRRQLRHLLAAELKHSKRGVDLMLSVKSPALTLDAEHRQALVHLLLQHARVI